MKLRYKIVIISILIVIAIPVSFIPFLHFSVYLANLEYVSSLPTIEVTGFLTDESNERHSSLKYSIHEGGFGPAIGSRYYLQDKDIDPQLVGEYVRINGHLENDYEGYLMKRGGDFEDYKIVRVIYVKELEITNAPFVP